VQLKGDTIRKALAEHLGTDRIGASPISDTGIDFWHTTGGSADLKLNLMGIRLWNYLTGGDINAPHPKFVGNIILASHDDDGEPAGLSLEGESHLRDVFEKHRPATCPICRNHRHRINQQPVRV
jgi:hypothetical protein